jgi:pentatricopeptide repeat protein
LKPDVVTYTTLLKYFVQVGDDSATQWVISEMETDPAVVQDVGVYNCLINAYARQGDMARALETLDSMLAKDIVPNIATYGTILEGYVRVGNVSEAVRVYDACKQTNGLSPDARMRKSLIYGCGLHGMSDVADCIIADLQSTGPEGAKEARKLHFVLQAAAGSDASSSAASPVRRRRRPAKKRPATTASGVASTSTTNDDDRLLEQTQSPEWNRGLEMWKHWLGLPNSYYADRVPADGSRDVDVDASSRADVTFGER